MQAPRDKLFFIQEFFSDFQKKINRLAELRNNSFEDEALTLCVVYIDWLASGRYYDGKGKDHSKENFCLALRELSGNDFFSAIHPKVLRNEVARCDDEIQAAIRSIVKAHVGRFFTVDEITRYLEDFPLPDDRQSSLITNLWRASVAAICYDRIRCQVVHGPGRSLNLAFGQIGYNGRVGMTIDFDLLYSALQAIHKKVESLSIESCKWFGNPQYK